MKYIIFLLSIQAGSIASYGQSLQIQKQKTLEKLKNARVETNDSVKASLYRDIGYDRKYFSSDSARILINEGLRFNEKRGVMDIHHLLLQLYSAKQDYHSIPMDSSIAKLKKLVPLAEGLNPRGKLYILKDIGLNYKLQGQYDSSIRYFNLAKRVALSSLDSFNMAKMVGHIAENYTRIDNFEKANILLDSLIIEYPKATRLPNVLSTLSFCYNRSRDYHKTIVLYKEQIRTRDKWEIATNAPGFTTLYCGALVGVDNYIEAERELTEHIAFYKKKQRYSTLNNLYGLLCSINQHYRNHEVALGLLDSCVKYKKNAGHFGFMLGVTKQKTEIYTAMGKSDSASHYLMMYEDLLQQKLDISIKEEFAKSFTYYETKEKEQKIALLEKENEIADARFWRLVYLGLIGLVFLIILGLVYNNRLLRRNAKSNQSMVEAQLTSIRSQLNPHFMFNALNSIKNYILKNDSRAASNYLAKFTRLMRGILDLSSKPSILLEKELDMLNLYIELEQMRFKNVFTYNLEISEEIDTGEIHVPPLFLQPFVENAIKHGLTPLEGERSGMLNLSITKSHTNLIFEIMDNGVGRDKIVQASTHLSKGVALSQKRIELTNNSSKNEKSILFFDLVDANKKPIGTKVQVNLKV